jgi:hypothetical protein
MCQTVEKYLLRKEIFLYTIVLIQVTSHTTANFAQSASQLLEIVKIMSEGTQMTNPMHANCVVLNIIESISL